MAWDDSAPTKDELTKAGWDSAPPTDSELGVSAPKPEQSWLEKTGRAAVNELPVLGGIAGGILGTPFDLIAGPMGNVAGAGIGGYLGTAAKNVINSYIDPQNAPKTTTQAIVDPIVGGVTQAGMQAGGELASPILSKMAGPVADYMRGLANKRFIAATGATGTQAAKMVENAGGVSQAADLIRPNVGFGNSQETIASNLSDALDKSGQAIGDSLKDLDSQGASVSRDQIVQSLRDRATQMSSSPATMDISNGLSSMADQVEGQAATNSADVAVENAADAGAPENMPLSEAEGVKRDFQRTENYNSPALSTEKVAADVYRQSVEDAATQANPDLAAQFKQNKDLYGVLSPIDSAASKRAWTTNQSPPGGFLDTAATVAGGVFGGPGGAATAAGARRLIAPRLNSAAAVGTDFVANLVRNAPASLGKWAPTLTQAAARGTTSLSATDYILQQTDPEYRQHLQSLQQGGSDQ